MVEKGGIEMIKKKIKWWVMKNYKDIKEMMKKIDGGLMIEYIIDVD